MKGTIVREYFALAVIGFWIVPSCCRSPLTREGIVSDLCGELLSRVVDVSSVDVHCEADNTKALRKTV